MSRIWTIILRERGGELIRPSVFFGHSVNSFSAINVIEDLALQPLAALSEVAVDVFDDTAACFTVAVGIGYGCVAMVFVVIIEVQ